MEKINIQFTLFSAFYSPLIAAMSGGFLREQGLDPSWSVAKPGKTALAALEDGSAHVVQSALSQGFTALNQGKTNAVVHFAQINEMDGFFLTAREPDTDFNWQKLEGAEVILFGGGQPLDMFRYACHKAGIDYSRIKAITVGGAAEMDKAFRQGQGQFVQQQGPYPQQLEADRLGHIVSQVGPFVGRCGFSSLASTRDWLSTDMAQAFTRAYTKTRQYMVDTPAEDIARAQQAYFPNTDQQVLSRCIASYQQLGCWTPHIEITTEAYNATLDIYDFNGLISARYAYDQVCARPPAV